MRVVTRPPWVPGGVDHLVVAAAVADDEIGDAAWEMLRAADVVPTAERVRLLPLVAAARGASDPDHPLVARGREVRTHTRARLPWLEAQGAPALAAIAAIAGPPMLLKGLPIARRHLTDPGLRPVHDLDVLVPVAAFPAAVRALRDAGWPVPDPTLQLPVDDHALGATAHGVAIDLHWLAHRSLTLRGAARAWGPGFWTAPITADEAWARVEPLPFGGVDCVAPSPADLLVQVIVHGAFVTYSSSPRWAADAALILRSAHPPDWDVVVDQAVRRRVTLEVRHSLDYLADDLGLDVPTAARNRLRAVRVGRRERWAHSVRTHPPVPARHRIRRLGARWVTLTTAETSPRAVGAAPRLVRVLAGRSAP